MSLKRCPVVKQCGEGQFTRIFFHPLLCTLVVMDFSFCTVQKEECSGGTYRDRESQLRVEQGQEGNRNRLGRSPPCCLAEGGECVEPHGLWRGSDTPAGGGSASFVNVNLEENIFGRAEKCRWGEALHFVFILHPCSLHLGGDREAEIKGYPPEAPKWREDWEEEGWPSSRKRGRKLLRREKHSGKVKNLLPQNRYKASFVILQQPLISYILHQCQSCAFFLFHYSSKITHSDYQSLKKIIGNIRKICFLNDDTLTAT